MEHVPQSEMEFPWFRRHQVTSYSSCHASLREAGRFRFLSILLEIVRNSLMENELLRYRFSVCFGIVRSLLICSDALFGA
jgi:hypothetical protein